MQILGIDPGYATTGFGVLHSSHGGTDALEAARDALR